MHNHQTEAHIYIFGNHIKFSEAKLVPSLKGKAKVYCKVHCNIKLFFHFCLFVFSSRHHSDQMSKGAQVSKVILCVKILKPLSE